jgi:hypothetical protein
MRNLERKKNKAKYFCEKRWGKHFLNMETNSNAIIV